MPEALFAFMMGLVAASVGIGTTLLFWRRRRWRIDHLRRVSHSETLQELTSLLRPLLQSLSPKVFVDYDGYFRESMFPDDEELYDFLHKHFIHFQETQLEIVQRRNYYPNVRISATLAGVQAALILMLLIATGTSYLSRIAFILPIEAYLIFESIFFLRISPRLFQEEIQAYKEVDDRFASLLSEKIYHIGNYG